MYVCVCVLVCARFLCCWTLPSCTTGLAMAAALCSVALNRQLACVFSSTSDTVFLHWTLTIVSRNVLSCLFRTLHDAVKSMDWPVPAHRATPRPWEVSAWPGRAYVLAAADPPQQIKIVLILINNSGPRTMNEGRERVWKWISSPIVNRFGGHSSESNPVAVYFANEIVSPRESLFSLRCALTTLMQRSFLAYEIFYHSNFAFALGFSRLVLLFDFTHYFFFFDTSV